MTITGTSHFISFSAALAYYRPYLGQPAFLGGDITPRGIRAKKDDTNERIVKAKIASGEIHLGKPTLKPGESLSVNHKEGRYFITSK